MKPTLSLLTIALIALMLTGCVENKPAPQLDSPDRSERIAAVKVARRQICAPRAPPCPR